MPVILVVEDDHVMLKAIGTILNKGGFKVLNAVNGRDAIEMLDNAEYDLVVTDLMMPYAGGLELVSRIRSDSSKNDIGVIVVSSVSNEEMIMEAFNLGANDYLKKPVMASELVFRIKKLLKNRNVQEIAEEEEEAYNEATDAQQNMFVAEPEPIVANKVHAEPARLVAVSRPVAEPAQKPQPDPRQAPAREEAEIRPQYIAPDIEQPAMPDRHDAAPPVLMSEPLVYVAPAIMPDPPASQRDKNKVMTTAVVVLSIIAIIVISLLLYFKFKSAS